MKYKKLIICIICFTFIIGSFGFKYVQGQSISSNLKSKQYNSNIDKPSSTKFLIKFKTGLSSSQTKDFLNNLKDKKNINLLNNLGYAEVEFNKDKSIQEISNNQIDKIEPEQYLGVQGFTPNDSYYSQQWYIPYSGINTVWQNSYTNLKDIKIAVIDSGICTNHLDLKDKISPGWNFLDQSNNVEDSLGHGCEVSGIISADINNSLGIAGIAPNVTLMPLKIIDDNGQGSYTNLAQAIVYAVDNGAQVINISLGGQNNSSILEDAVNYAKNKNVTIIAAAGNTSNNQILYPANYSSVISVGSVDVNNNISNFSSISRNIMVWAPGNNILTTTLNNAYTQVNGTSFSSAIATGAYALNLLTNNKFKTNGTILNLDPEVNIRPKLLTTSIYKDDKYNWSVKYPGNWIPLLGFENPDTSNPVINRRVLFYTSSNEIISIDVWDNINNLNIFNAFLKIHSNLLQKQDIPSNTNGYVDGNPTVLAADLHTDNHNIMHKIVMFKDGKNLFAITYSIINGFSEKAYEDFIKNFILNSSHGETDLKNLPELSNQFKDQLAIQAYAEDYCGPNREYYLSGNPFPCASACSLTKTNCTWWAIYKRPDLKTKITYGNAGQSWIDEANAANIPVFPVGSPVDGSIAVWNGHVAYVNSHNSNGTFNVSEMNCNNTSYPGPENINVQSNYLSNMPMTGLGFIGGGNPWDIVVQNEWVQSGQTKNYVASHSISILQPSLFDPGSTVHFYIQ